MFLMELIMQHNVVCRDEWIAARKAHLAKEKALTKARDQLSAERRALPWVKVEKITCSIRLRERRRSAISSPPAAS